MSFPLEINSSNLGWNEIQATLFAGQIVLYCERVMGCDHKRAYNRQ